MRILEWFEPGEGASVSSLETLQSALGHALPADYADFVSRHSGANNPSACAFTVQEADGSRFGSNFGAVLRVDGEDDGSILGTMRDLGEQLPPGVVPIVDTGFGDHVCLRFSEAGQSAVVYYSHDRPLAEALLPLAPTFTGFLDLLEVPADE